MERNIELAEVHIAALTASIAHQESMTPSGNRTEISQALRRQRGAWLLYRNGAGGRFAEPPPPLGAAPQLIPIGPCPQMTDEELDLCETQRATSHESQSGAQRDGEGNTIDRQATKDQMALAVV